MAVAVVVVVAAAAVSSPPGLFSQARAHLNPAESAERQTDNFSHIQSRPQSIDRVSTLDSDKYKFVLKSVGVLFGEISKENNADILL